MIIDRKRRRLIDGVALLALAAVFLWFPTALKKPREAYHQVLVATAQMTEKDPFRGAQILVLKHNSYGAMGVVINRAHDGGPIKKKKDVTFYDIAKAPAGAVPMPELGIAYKIDADDKTGIVYRGRAEWAPGQLDRELANGAWTIIPADKTMVLK